MHALALPLYAVAILLALNVFNHILGMLKSWLKIREMRIKRAKKKPISQMDVLRKRFADQRKRNFKRA